ncbi:MAG: RICIN domain-containing protein [Ruminococcus sp.]
MKHRLKKLISSLLSVIMVFGVLTVAPFTVNAASFTPRTTAPDSSNAYYYSSNPFYQSGYGMPNCTCYAYGRAYELLGSKPRLSTGNAGYWWWYNKNNGIYSYGSTPKLGAIACWDKYDQNQGHVAVVEAIDGNSVTISESHYKSTFFDTRTITANSSNYLTSMRFLGYIYIGDFDPNPVDLGTDFYAYIINTYAWKHLTNDGPNVSMRSETGEANQVWKFDRQSDGSYKITNCQDGLVLDDQNFGTTDGTNVAVAGSNDSSAQRWYISGESAAYCFRAACGNLVLDIAGGSTDDGANVQMWTKNDSTAQKFQIWKLNKPSQTYVHCAAGTNYVPTIIWWNESEYTKYYDIKIWKGTVWEGDAYKILWNLTDTTCEVNLPAGYYEAYVDTRNNFSTTMSNNVIKFTVTEDTPLNLGEDFYAALLVNKNWVNVSNINTNVELAENNHGSAEQIWHFMKQSDGSYIIVSCLDGKALDVCNAENDNGTNVQVHKINYTDAQKWYIYGRWSGEYYLKPKCSNKVLDVCGGNNVAGDNMQIWELNYTDAQKFAIWGVEPAGKSELSVESGSSLKNTCFNWTKSDNTDEYEVKVWKGIAFDDDPFITFNTTETSWSTALPAGNYMACVFSKNSFSSEQSNIVSFTVEYINNVGDVNGDGMISISDAAELQEYLVNLITFDDEQFAAADADGDGRVSIGDVTKIQQYLASIITSLG